MKLAQQRAGRSISATLLIVLVLLVLWIPASAGSQQPDSPVPSLSRPWIAISEFPLPHAVSRPGAIIAGPADDLWFLEYRDPYNDADQVIGRISTAGTVLAEYPAPNARALLLGPDGNLWYTNIYSNTIGKMTTSGEITEFLIPTPNSIPNGLTVGPDDHIWFTEKNGPKIGRISVEGSFTEFPLSDGLGAPAAIARGPDGALWFTFHYCSHSEGLKLGRITIDGQVSSYSISDCSVFGGSVITGPDNNLWVTGYNGFDPQRNRVIRVTTDGVATSFPASNIDYLILGPDGNFWFPSFYGNSIGRFTLEGEVTNFALPTANSGPWDMTVGPDGALWFTQLSGNRIGRAVFVELQARSWLPLVRQ